MKITIKIGSNQLKLSISKQTTCIELIRMALMQCKIGKPVVHKRFFFKSFQKLELNEAIVLNYGLFERAIGIERQIESNENIAQLWLKWNSSGQYQMQLIIKYLSLTNTQLIQRCIQNNSHNSQRLFKYYKKQIKTTRNAEVDSHEYESIDISISYHKLVNKSLTDSSIKSSTSSEIKPLIEL